MLARQWYIHVAVMFICIALCIPACTVREGVVYKKDDKLYGTVDGLFKEKWNDYYARGMSYAAGEYWDEAIADFKEARRRRGKDQRRARTYGMHFIDYFPNRELGIAFYNTGKYPEAIECLETSIRSYKTARAAFYLNKARGKWLEETNLDRKAPDLSIVTPLESQIIRDLSIRIKVRARDDYFVSGVSFNEVSVPLEYTQKEVSVSHEVSLTEGHNRISMHAVDLLGRTSSPVILNVTVDRQGPLIFLEGRRNAGGTVTVRGAAYDTSGIASISFNRTHEAHHPGKPFLKINEQLPQETVGNGSEISYAVSDAAGNTTSGILAVSEHGNSGTRGIPVCLAFAGTPESPNALPPMTLPRYTAARPGSAQDHAAPAKPNIDLKNLKNGHTVYSDTLFLEGTVSSSQGIRDIQVNGISLLDAPHDRFFESFLQELFKTGKRLIAFSKLVGLTEGENTITIDMVDVSGQRISKTITVIRKIPRARQIGSRLSLTIYPFQKHGSGEPIADYIQATLSHAFVNQKRFNVLERRHLDKLLTEQQMSQESVFDRKTAIRLGRLMTSETILLGDVFILKNNTMEIVSRIVDTETSLILAEKDAYFEGDTNVALREVLTGLALKFKEQFPLCEGSIIDAAAPGVLFNLGRADSIFRGMRLLSFQETAPVTADSVAPLGMDTKILGLISTTEVRERFSKGTIVKTFTPQQIAAGDKVITK